MSEVSSGTFGDVWSSPACVVMYLSIANFNQDTHWALVLTVDPKAWITYLGNQIHDGDVVQIHNRIFDEMVPL